MGNFTKWLSKNAPTILSNIACIGVAVTAWLSGKGAVKAEQTKKEWTEEKHEELTKFEKVQATIHSSIPAIISGAITIGCIIASGKISANQIATITGAAAVTAKQFSDYKRNNIAENGIKAHQKVEEAIVLEKAKNTRISAESFCDITSLSVSDTLETEHVFYDSITEQRFVSTLSKVLEAEYHLNRNFTLGHPEVDVDMWCDFLGISHVESADIMGWALCDDYTWIDFNHTKAVLEDGIECIIIDCIQAPQVGYSDWDVDEPWPDKYGENGNSSI